MKIIMVGCGAVGQVFSLFLQKAGVELGLYDQPASVEKLRQALEQGGLPLYQTGRRLDASLQRLVNYRVLANVAECQRFGPDQVWFATPSPVYHSKWFREFIQTVSSKRVVCFAPEGERAEFLPENGTSDRMVFGGITFMAWQGGPQAGGGQAGGVNFWLPPLLGIPLSGDEQACSEVAQLLKKAGLRVEIQKKPSPMQASVTGVMTAFVAGLELSGWTLRAFRNSPWLRRSARASREAFVSQLAKAGFFTKALLGIVFSSTGLYLATFFLPLLFPFNLEKYLKFHYLKTRDQSLTLLELFAKDGIQRGRPVENIHSLLQGLRAPADGQR